MNPDPRLELFDRHRTVRKYKPEALKPGDLEQILWAAQRAPTDATAQMYSFVRLTDPALRNEIATITGNPHLQTASEAFIVLADVNRLQRLLEHRGYEFGDWPAIGIHFGIGDAVLAGQNMLIAAEMLGYAGCWIGGVLSALERIVEVLELPPGVLPFAGLTIGVSDETPAQRPRIQPELILFENKYRQPETHELETALERMAPITARGDWAQTLSRYFAKDGTMEAREIQLRRTLERQGFGHVRSDSTGSDSTGSDSTGSDLTGSDLNALMTRVLEAGYNDFHVRPVGNTFQAWVSRPDRAHSGEGSSPHEALERAVVTAEADQE